MYRILKCRCCGEKAEHAFLQEVKSPTGKAVWGLWRCLACQAYVLHRKGKKEDI